MVTKKMRKCQKGCAEFTMPSKAIKDAVNHIEDLIIKGGHLLSDKTKSLTVAMDNFVFRKAEAAIGEDREKDKDLDGMVINAAVKQYSGEDKPKESDDQVTNPEDKSAQYKEPDLTFETPEMGDYYLGAVDTQYLENLDATLDQKIDDDDDLIKKTNGKNGEGNGKNAAFYTEDLPIRNTGKQADGSYFLPVTPVMTQDMIDSGWANASRLVFKAGALEDGNNGFFDQSGKNIKDSYYKQKSKYGGIEDNDYVFFDMNGLTGPQPPVWAYEQNIPADSVEWKQITAGDFKSYGGVTSGVHDDDEEIYVINVNGTWREATLEKPASSDDKTISFRWLVDRQEGNGEKESAARDSAARLSKIITNSDDGKVYLHIDPTAQTRNGSILPEDFNADDSKQAFKGLANGWQHGRQNAYCLGASDALGHLRGDAYIKKDGKWINLSKAVLCEDNSPYYADNDTGTENPNFKKNYDQKDHNLADAYLKLEDLVDDRAKIQNMIFGKDWDELRRWTVTIGDVTLFVPPESISVDSKTVADRVPLLRAKGTMAKGSKNTERWITMNIYFSGERGINGYKYNASSPSGDKFVYSLNSLRALQSEFHFTPFLPIDNDYINNVLGISACLLHSISVNSCPGFPQLMYAQIVISEFDYAVYMPQLYELTGSDSNVTNPFAASINWQTMRYYYQRPIMNGDQMRADSYDMTSKEYLKQSLKFRTTFQPMLFKSSELKFYIADPAYLDMMERQRMDNFKKEMGSTEDLPSNQKDFVNKIGNMYGKPFSDAIGSDEMKQALSAFNEGDKCFNNGDFDSSLPILGTDRAITDTGLDKNSEQKLNSVVGTLAQKMKEANGTGSLLDMNRVSTFSTKQKLNDGTSIIYVGVSFPVLHNGLSDSDVDNVKYQVAAASGNTDQNKMLQHDRVNIPFAIHVGPKDADHPDQLVPIGDLELDEKAPDVQFMKFCGNSVSDAAKEQEKLKKKAKEDNSDETQSKWKNSANIDALQNMQFQLFETGTIIVKDWNVAVANRFSTNHVVDNDGLSPQYLGGSDTSIEVNLVTTSEQTVTTLQSLPQLESFLMRKYRKVIPHAPIRIDSEFSRFFGVSDVLVDEVTVDTIKDIPGAYSIQLKMTSIDRTVRQQEALRMLEADNNGRKYSGYFWGRDENSYGEKALKGYFDMMEQLGYAELYPDLELPKVSELKELGWEFVRYKFQDNRVYVDPDFYFVYLNKLSCQLIREMVVRSSSNGYDGSSTLTDATGAEVSIQPKKFNGYQVTDMNETSMKQQQSIGDARGMQKRLNEKKTKENLHKDKNEVLTEDFEGWDINNDIKAMFMESRYKKEYDAYKSAIENQGINQTETAATNTNVASSNDTGHTDVKSAATASSDDANIQPEGKWVAQQLLSAQQASSMIDNYLNGTGIPVSIPNYNAVYVQATGHDSVDPDFNMKNPAQEKVLKDGTNLDDYYESADYATGATTNIKGAQSIIEAEIEEGVKEFFGQAAIIGALDLLNMDVSNAEFLNIAKDIVYAAAAAATGDKEYSNKDLATNWRPNPKFLGYIGSKGARQDYAKPTLADSTEEAIKLATEVGCFKIKQYTSNELLAMTGVAGDDVWESDGTVNTSRWLLDPYYRYKPVDDIEAYKRGCINSPKFCTYAYLRNALYWLKYLIDNQAFPSINADVLRKAAHNEIDIQKLISKNNATDKDTAIGNRVLQQHINFFQKNGYCVDTGKVWTMCVLASGDGDKLMKQRIDDRDYRGLNEYVHGCQVPKNSVDTSDKLSLMIRKMSLALIGRGRIKDVDVTGVKQNERAISHARDESEKKYIECAEDPNKYMMHSCHDMVVGDARGRMLRAFPTFYMLFVDEGRDIGEYHLHDNFYNVMSISEIMVMKSRKNPADTAQITLTNIFQTYTTEQEDLVRSKVPGWGEAFETWLAPVWSGAAEDQETKRREKGAENFLKLRAGARIHLRMGYGSNAAMLPVVFNGVAAEVNCESTVNIIAQGDGIELMNPIVDDEEAHRVQTDRTWMNNLLQNGETPKNIMIGILTSDGGTVRHILKLVGKTDLIGNNPYGISHFGLKDFTSISQSGETVQNIFEAWGKPAWGGDAGVNSATLSSAVKAGIDNLPRFFTGKEFETAQDAQTTDKGYGSTDSDAWFDGGAPHITFELFGKTVWECANICKSVMPDFIAAVAPFDMRSTLFIGHPRYYYAYSYHQINGAILERRKPFQQYHIYTSSTDIIANGIVATSRDMKTAAIGLYTKCHTANTKEQHRVGPLYVDIDIYPENQKTMVVDTKYGGKGPTGLGLVTNFFTSFDFIDDLFDDEGSMVSDKKIAWRMTASALKDSVKDMYAGDMVIFGDPTVKPHDRIFIADQYEGISGQATVKEVTHRMSVDDGFITTVTPDAICTIDDKFESIVHHWFNGIGVITSTHIALSAFIINAYKFNNVTTRSAVLAGLRPDAMLNKMQALTGKNLEAAMAKYGGQFSKAASAAAKPFMGSAAKKGVIAAIKKTAEKADAWLAKKGLTKAAEGAIAAPVAGAVAAAGAAVFGTGALAALATLAIATLAVESIGSFINQKIANFAKNLQVMTVYPLTRYGMTWTAGLGGSKGLIFGSPTFHEQGAVQSLLDDFCGHSDNALIDFMKGVFWSDDVMDACSKYARDGGVIGDDMAPAGSELSFDNFLRSAAGGAGQAGDAALKNDYRRMQMQPRADYSTGDDIPLAYNHFALLDTNGYQNDPKLQYLRLVSDDARFQPYKDEDFFRIIHEDPGLNQGKEVDTKVMKLNGSEQYVKIIKNYNSDGSPILDMPLLNPEAINILYELVRRAKGHMPSANSSDQQETYEKTKGSYVILESAERIGDKSSMGATGYTFIVRGIDKAAQPLAKAINELYKEIEKDGKSSSVCETYLFDSRDLGENKTAIVVRMPRVSGANDQNATEQAKTASGSADSDGSGDNTASDSGSSDTSSSSETTESADSGGSNQ